MFCSFLLGGFYNKSQAEKKKTLINYLGVQEGLVSSIEKKRKLPARSPATMSARSVSSMPEEEEKMSFNSARE